MRLFLTNQREVEHYSNVERSIVSLRAAAAAHVRLAQWPGYAPSPLRELNAYADRAGISRILYKDESRRFDLGSFKVLGGGYAAELAIAASGRDPADLTLVCATDGNHGQAVAFAARRHGSRARVYMHAKALEERAARIRTLGAEVIRTGGSYDDSVCIAQAAAADHGDWLLISDTSDGEDDPVPAWVMQGYSVIALELFEQLAAPPTHVFVQAGVGGLAAAIGGLFAERYGGDRPRFVVVEPLAAASLLESAVAGAPTTVCGELDTAMAMLSCGKPSVLAWTILARRADAFMAIDDPSAIGCAEQLRDTGIDVGVSGAAGLAAALCIAACASSRLKLGLGSDAVILVIGTEGGALRIDQQAAA